jgi:hypothetical protein
MCCIGRGVFFINFLECLDTVFTFAITSPVILCIGSVRQYPVYYQERQNSSILPLIRKKDTKRLVNADTKIKDIF